MGELLDDVYLQWLYRQVLSPRFRQPSRTYWNLLNHLYKRRFIWFVPNDDNRAEDGRDLRLEFFEETHTEFNQDWYDLDCSIFEMIIALSRRLSFEADNTAESWFWELLNNLGLAGYNDAVYRDRESLEAEEVDHIIDRLNARTYEFDGSGGLFPLKYPHEDQRQVEIWYQLNAYLAECDI